MRLASALGRRRVKYANHLDSTFAKEAYGHKRQAEKNAGKRHEAARKIETCHIRFLYLYDDVFPK